MLRTHLLIFPYLVSHLAYAEENVTARARHRSDDRPTANFNKAVWPTRSSVKTSWSLPALATGLANARVINAEDRMKKPSRQEAGNAFEKKFSSSVQSAGKYFTPDHGDYYHDVTSSFSDIANFENSRVSDYAKYFAHRPVQPMPTAATNGPRILDIVMHNDPYRNPRKGIHGSDKLFAQESNAKNTLYYEPAANVKKNDKYDRRGHGPPADKNRRYDFDYSSRELDDYRSDRRDDHWDDWEDYHDDKYHHDKHYKKDYDPILPLLVLILAPLAVSSLLMPLTATLISNSMYYAGAQGAIFQGRKRRSLDGRAEQRDLLLDSINLLEEAIQRFEKNANQSRKVAKTP